MKNLINEREINQRMIKLLNEEAPTEAPAEAMANGPEEVTGGTDESVMGPSKSDVSTDQATFRDHIASDAKFTEFSILPDAGNVVFKGSIPGLCEWKFELLERNGPQIIMNEPVVFTPEILEIFKNMIGYCDNWREAWGPKLAEYKQNGNS